MALNEERIKREYPWLNKEFLQTLVREKYNDQLIEVINCNAVPAIGPGENYASVVVRVVLTLKNFKRDSLNAVFKLNHAREDLAELMDGYDVFAKESLFYKRILNRVHDMLKSSGIKVKLSAQLIANSSKPSFVMFEDLKPQGYAVINKFNGLDYEHLQLTLRKLAYWHAATACLGEKEPSSMDDFRECIFVTGDGPIQKMLKTFLFKLGHEATKWNGMKEIGEKIQKLSEEIISRGMKLYATSSDDFNVLCHGDLWLCNIMYRYDTAKKLDDVIMVDYSIGVWGNPGFDLSYLLMSSSADNVTEEDWDNLLMDYYAVLSSTLKILNYPKKIPRFYDIYVNYLKTTQFTLAVSFMVASIRQLVNVEKGNLANLLDDSPEAQKFHEELLTNPKFKCYAEKLMKFLNRKGLLD